VAARDERTEQGLDRVAWDGHDPRDVALEGKARGAGIESEWWEIARSPSFDHNVERD
jgi:hypothetical protein